MNWIASNLDLIGSLTLVHLRHSLIPLIIGLVLSLPVGWLAWRVQWLRSTLVLTTGLLYTIPSLALLTILPAVMGVAPYVEINLIVALTLYAVALLVRTVVDGLTAVDDDTRLAATAMGYGPFTRVLKVDFPLAGPVILAGLRVVSASTVALATVGILVGVNNLGYLFTNGFQRRIIPEVLAGIGAVVLITLVIDAILVALGRLLLPWAKTNAEAHV